MNQLSEHWILQQGFPCDGRTRMHLVGQGQNIIAIHYQWGHNDGLSNLGLALQSLAPNQQLLLYNKLLLLLFSTNRIITCSVLEHFLSLKI